MVRTGLTLVAIAVGLGAFATRFVVSRVEVVFFDVGDDFRGAAI